MISIINTVSLNGLNGNLIKVQTCITSGLPKFEIVGLPDITIKESKERIIFAIKNSNIQFPSKKIIVNLAPADVRKEGAGYDLPIAIGILQEMGIIKHKNYNDTIFIGELGLDGKLNKVNGALAMCLEACKYNIKKVILPKENEQEALFVKDVQIIAVENLKELIEYLNNTKKINSKTVDIKNLLNKEKEYEYNFEQIYGQENVKRALEIAVAGGHNCIIIGSPGTGKTLLAKSVESILPDLTVNEALELTKIYSVSGNLKDKKIMANRPFRNPHHTISAVSMIGGGKVPIPGEITLAHLGVLFLDELPEFKKSTLEAMREPLEDKKVTINRVNQILEYPCKFMLIASMNPCPCGFYGDKEKECTCKEKDIKKYIQKISGPFMDRIDIKVEAMQVKYEKISSKINVETSKQIKIRINNARKLQIERYEYDNIFSNSELTPNLIKKYCYIDKSSSELLKQAYNKFKLSIRAYNKILKVARTIADLDNKQQIEIKHIAEAIQYRNIESDVT